MRSISLFGKIMYAGLGLFVLVSFFFMGYMFGFDPHKKLAEAKVVVTIEMIEDGKHVARLKHPFILGADPIALHDAKTVQESKRVLLVSVE